MEIRILFWGELGARFGREHVLEVEPGATVADLRRRLAAGIDGAGEALAKSGVRFALDQTVAPESAPIAPGQEIAVLPIYSGG